jgi:nucleoside triphosphate diphosphatase
MDSEEENLSERMDAGGAFNRAVETMARLRAPGGCPWDREQNFDTIRRYTLEETYEVLDAIERRSWSDLEEELGDLLLQVLFYSQMAAEANYFTVAEVIEGLNRKLVRRHPHVFGEAASAAAGNSVQSLTTEGIDAARVLHNWDKIKQAEKFGPGSETDSVLDSIPRAMPALLEAAKLGSRAAKSGFDWPDVEGLFAKINEETAELRQAMGEAETNDSDSAHAAIEAEVGDLLFTAVNLARRLKVDPEMALRGSNAKFRRRFRTMENSSAEPLESLSLAALDRLWDAAKQSERKDGDSGR